MKSWNNQDYFFIVPTKQPIPSACNDLDPKYCNAQKSRCVYNRALMSANCKKTCKMCSPNSKCFDKDSICPYWKLQGYCKNGSPYQSHMKKTCKFTCTGC